MSSIVARKNGSVLGKVRFILLLAVASCIHCDKLETGGSALAPAPSDARTQAVLEEQLNALGYLGAVEAPDAGGRGVRVHEPRKIQAGWTLLALKNSDNARLLAADGEVVHRWHADVREWKLAIPRPNGDLLVLDTARGVLRIDRDSRVLWRTDFRTHHDLVVDADKHIWALGRQKRLVSLDGASVWVNDDTIVELSSSGDILQEILLLEAVDRRYWEPRLRYGLSIEAGGDRDPTILGAPRDIFHANSVDVVSQAIPGICQKGALLVSIRSLNLVAIIDRVSMKMVWHASNQLRGSPASRDIPGERTSAGVRQWPSETAQPRVGDRSCWARHHLGVRSG